MLSRGHEVFAVCPDGDPAHVDLLTQWGASFHPILLDRAGLNPIADLNALRSLISVFQRIAPEVIYAYTIKPVIYGSLAAKWVGKPRIFSTITGLGHVFLNHSLKGRLVRPIIKRMYQAALSLNETVFFQNADDAKAFVDWGLVPQNKTHVVNGSGVDLMTFQPSPLPKGPVTFLFVGRLLREKGLVELMDATRQVRETYPDVMVTLVGDLDENPSGLTEDEVAAWEAVGLIKRVGFVEDVRPHLAACSVFVLPSYREGTSRSTLEALALGRPVITTDAPGCREPVVDGENGYLVPVGEAGPLADAMMRFLAEPELVATMGAASLAIARARYDVVLVNADILGRMAL
jgi:glycosyltransferase involved in cell wall biosynthesis